MSSMGPMLGMVISVDSALGLAAMTALAAAHDAGQLGNIGALTNGYSAAFPGAAGIAGIAGALMAAMTPPEGAGGGAGLGLRARAHPGLTAIAVARQASHLRGARRPRTSSRRVLASDDLATDA